MRGGTAVTRRSGMLLVVIAIVLAGCGGQSITQDTAQAGNPAAVLPTPTPETNRQPVAFTAQPALGDDIVLEDRLF